MLACDGQPQQAPEASTPSAAQRIVTLAPHLAELVVAAGAGDRLIGVSAFTDFPAQAAGLPEIGDAFRVDLEAVAALRPDLILAWSSGNPAELIARLKRLGYRVIALETGSLDDIAEQLELIGDLAGTQAVAGAAAQKLRRRIATLQARYGPAAPVRVFYQLSARPLMTVSNRHVIGQIISLCGGENLFGGLAELVPSVSVEAVLDAAPQAILAAVSQPRTRSELDTWRKWPNLPAVRDGHLYVVEADLLSRPGPRLVEGARQLCERLDRAREDAVELS